MDRDRIKRILLDCMPCDTDFTVVLSGTSSRAVNGLYKPDTAEIVIHNRNFDSDNQMLYTALHEYAHHIHGIKKSGMVSGRSHTNEFWSIFHELLLSAEEKGYYENVFETNAEFRNLTDRIRTTCVGENGRIMLELGRLMSEARTLCEKHRTRFEDYVDRALGVPRTTAGAAVKAAALRIDPSIGWDGMKIAVGIKDEERRAEAVRELASGTSPAAVKARFAAAQAPEDPVERLLHEQRRLERLIDSLNARLEDVRGRLADLS